MKKTEIEVGALYDGDPRHTASVSYRSHAKLVVLGPAEKRDKKVWAQDAYRPHNKPTWMFPCAVYQYGVTLFHWIEPRCFARSWEANEKALTRETELAAAKRDRNIRTTNASRNLSTLAGIDATVAKPKYGSATVTMSTEDAEILIARLERLENDAYGD